MKNFFKVLWDSIKLIWYRIKDIFCKHVENPGVEIEISAEDDIPMEDTVCVDVVAEKKSVIKEENVECSDEDRLSLADLIRPIVKACNIDEDKVTALDKAANGVIKTLKTYATLDENGHIIFRFTQSDSYNALINSFIEQIILDPFVKATKAWADEKGLKINLTVREGKINLGLYKEIEVEE